MLACMVMRASVGTPPPLLPYGRRHGAQVDVHTVRGADDLARVHLLPYSVTATFRQPPEMLHLAAYLRPNSCEKTQRLLGVRVDGTRWRRMPRW